MWVVQVRVGVEPDVWEDVGYYEWQSAARARQRELKEEGRVAIVTWEE